MTLETPNTYWKLASDECGRFYLLFPNGQTKEQVSREFYEDFKAALAINPFEYPGPVPLHVWRLMNFASV